MVMRGVNTNPNLIFMTNPLEIFEHPIDLPTDPKIMPIGPIDNWLCFAPNFSSRSSFVGPFKAVITRPYRDDSLIIKCNKDSCGESTFWFQETTLVNQRTVTRPRWYQSSCTLRFVKERKYPHVKFVYRTSELLEVLVPKFHIDVLGKDLAFKNETDMSPDCVVSVSDSLSDQYGNPYNDTDYKDKEYDLSKMGEIVKHRLRNDDPLFRNKVKGLVNLIDGM